MGETTGISWTNATFNPWIGCTRVSLACDHCYAESYVSVRLKSPQLWNGERRRTSQATWNIPRKLNRKAAESGKRTKIFCASLADVFDNQVPNEWRTDLFELIRNTPNIDWQLLTKRPQNIEKMLPKDWGDGWSNVWLGATTENQKEADRRIRRLLDIPAVVHFISAEPLLGPLDIRDYLSDNPIYGGLQTERGICLCSGDLRGSGDHAGWYDLARSETRLGSLEKDSSEQAVPPRSRGARLRGVLAGSNNVERQESLCFGASSNLPSLQGADPRSDDDQSRRRQEETEPPRQFGADDFIGSTSPCSSCSESRKNLQSGWNEEFNGENLDRASRRNPQAPIEWGETAINRQGLRDRVPDRIKNCQNGKPFKGLSWVICGTESGTNVRPSEDSWFRSLRDQCAGRAAFWMKQIMIEGKLVKNITGFPEDLRVQEFPKI